MTSMGNYFTYITTNPKRTTLYVGITNDLYTRMVQHYQARGKWKSFAGRFYCYNLVYFERHDNPMDAISREKEIKRWRRSKKESLITSQNPNWDFYDIKAF